jgi:DNA-binding Xre family transcriptional regulator
MLFTCFNSFGHSYFSYKKAIKSNILDILDKDKEEKLNVLNDSEIELLVNNNLCEILSIKPSDLLNKKMLKKLKANV